MPNRFRLRPGVLPFRSLASAIARGFRRRGVWLCLPQAAALFPLAAWAGEGAENSSVWYTVMLIQGLFSIALACVSIWYFTRPKPSYSEQFAAKAHTHTEFAPLEHTHSIYATTVELQQLRREFNAATAEHRSDVKETNKTLKEIREIISDHASSMHKRLDPIANLVAANDKLLTEHLADHRQSKHNQTHGN